MRFVILFFLIVFQSQAQVENDSISDDRYFEDQFYLGLSYNFILNHPEGANQRNLSYGLQAGVIKDIPLNNTGTNAIGIGAGLALNSYYSNLVSNISNDIITYSINNDITRSKLETHLLEFPLEFRWRNSTAEEYKFWRIYGGIKAAYVLGARSKFDLDSISEGFTNTDITKFQYGLTLNFGYNTFNLHAYYALTELFNGNASVNGEVLQYRPLRIGLIFYIL
ncbi:outer membrane protein with beta-barrel domain [Maribacter spongiicola]|uniref:Outer membrane protein with beta-barrel domain n=1 Tax=Maribacter spongiicola TaxID=1206753 RepID=A0A4V3ERN3_9FLAO|nr:porin family protein [Maribacter spongiicola]TDT46833.1 outer membrane protein with beta-barrel domain [Maribacter spongiicola]